VPVDRFQDVDRRVHRHIANEAVAELFVQPHGDLVDRQVLADGGEILVAEQRDGQVDTTARGPLLLYGLGGSVADQGIHEKLETSLQDGFAQSLLRLAHEVNLVAVEPNPRGPGAGVVDDEVDVSTS